MESSSFYEMKNRYNILKQRWSIPVSEICYAFDYLMTNQRNLRMIRFKNHANVVSRAASEGVS